jgi:hypothetical protein
MPAHGKNSAMGKIMQMPSNILDIVTYWPFVEEGKSVTTARVKVSIDKESTFESG